MPQKRREVVSLSYCPRTCVGTTYYAAAHRSASVLAQFIVKGFTYGNTRLPQKFVQSLGNELWQSYHTFGFVRHPFHRLQSTYAYTATQTKKHRRGSLTNWTGTNNDPFWKWGSVKAYLESDGFSAFIRHPLWLSSPLARPQTDYFYDGNTRLVKHVGRLENLESDFATVAKSLQLPTWELGFENMSDHESQHDTSQGLGSDLGSVYDSYRSDYDAFGYSKTP